MDGPSEPPSSLSLARAKWERQIQYWLDKSSPHVTPRWIALAVVILLYILRVWYLQGFYIVTYGLGIYNLNLLLGFLTPQVDPESEGPELPTKSDQEFRPFIRRLPEFKFWYSALKSVVIGTLMTFFKMFDVPVFWPILLLYWFILFFVTMKRQIRHMIKYRYLPFSWGKKKYTGRPGEKRPEKDAKDGSPPPSAHNAGSPLPSPQPAPLTHVNSGGLMPVYPGPNTATATSTATSLGPPPITFPTSRFPAANSLMSGSAATGAQYPGQANGQQPQSGYGYI